MGEAKRRAGKPEHHNRKRVGQRVNAQFGQVMVGADPQTMREFGMRPDQWGWYVWPEDLNSLEAIMADALLGPYPSEEAAKTAAAVTWWEKQ